MALNPKITTPGLPFPSSPVPATKQTGGTLPPSSKSTGGNAPMKQKTTGGQLPPRSKVTGGNGPMQRVGGLLAGSRSGVGRLQKAGFNPQAPHRHTPSSTGGYDGS